MSENSPLNITSIDCRQGDATQLFRELRDKLSPRGDVVSEAGKQRTIELFGAALSPREVVERICEDVRTKGTVALLDYTARLDRKQLTRDTIRVTEDELEAASKAVSASMRAAVGASSIAARRPNCRDQITRAFSTRAMDSPGTSAAAMICLNA